MVKKIRERKPTSCSGFIKGFLGHLAFYISWPHTLATWLHKIRGVNIDNPRRVRIAANVLIDSLYPELVIIENDVFITRGTTIVAHLEPTPFLRDVIGDTQFGRVHIKKGAYIGVYSIILPGITIGRGAIVGAGSVVTKDVQNYTVVAGNPARVIKTIDEFKERIKEKIDNPESS